MTGLFVSWAICSRSCLNLITSILYKWYDEKLCYSRRTARRAVYNYVSRNLVNCCATAGTSCTNPQQIEVTELELCGRLTCRAWNIEPRRTCMFMCIQPWRVDRRDCAQQARPSASFVDNTSKLPWRNCPEFWTKFHTKRIFVFLSSCICWSYINVLLFPILLFEGRSTRIYLQLNTVTEYGRSKEPPTPKMNLIRSYVSTQIRLVADRHSQTATASGPIVR